MKHQGQRIAEACPTIFVVDAYGMVRYRMDHQKAGSYVDLLTDLNAMREAENAADLDFYPLREKYCAILDEICLRDKSEWPLWRATAAQRAEAFLRTIGKWVDE